MSPASTCLSLRCGVLWSEGQFTLDCRECGGFAADRPCVDCDGHCGQVWRRDVPTVSKQMQTISERAKKRRALGCATPPMGEILGQNLEPSVLQCSIKSNNFRAGGAYPGILLLILQHHA